LLSVFALGFCLIFVGRLNGQVIVTTGGTPPSGPSGQQSIYTLSISEPLQYTITTANTGAIYFEFEHGGDFGSLLTLNLTFTIDGGSPQPVQSLNNDPDSIDFELYENAPQVMHVGSILTLGPGNLTSSFTGSGNVFVSDAGNSSPAFYTFPSSYVASSANNAALSGQGMVVVPEPATYALLFGPAVLIAASCFRKRKKCRRKLRRPVRAGCFLNS
jgi:hypothetical protein